MDETLLSNMDIDMSDVLKTLAFDIGNEDVGCYVTVLDAKQIKSISRVSRVDEDPQNGYQRTLNSKRADDIKNYLESGNIIPGSIILSAQSGSGITYNKESRELALEPASSSLFVIDGQHRLFGASLSDNDIPLPVCIFTGLDTKQEVQYFLDINSNQKGVPKTLRIELLKFLSEPESDDAVRNNLFKALNEDVASPLFGRMSPTVSSPGKVSHVPFQNAIDPLLKGSVLRQFDFERKKVIIINFLCAVEDTLKTIEGNPKRLTSSAFFQAIFKIFEDVCAMSLTYHKNYKESSIRSVLEGIEKIDFSKHSGSNQQAINDLSNDFKYLLEIHAQILGTPDDLLL